MKDQLIIPNKIKVGYVNRQDTYTKKLAYVIYYDTKGVLRKETSWEGWRDKKIEPDDFENVPTEGFVLNKKAGGYSTGWNHRATYCRVFDPRGFEFEISIPNLLFILQECNALKGKGLDGEFVYAWEGKDLVLLPVGCEDYKKSSLFTNMQTNKVSAKELLPGCVYQTKKQAKIIYMGKFNWYAMNYFEKGENKYASKQKVAKDKKFFIFANESDGKYTFDQETSVSHLSNLVSDIPVTNFAEIMEEFNKKHNSSCPVSIETKPAEIIFNEIDYSNGYYYNDKNNVGTFFLAEDKGLRSYVIKASLNYAGNGKGDNGTPYVFQGYMITKSYYYEFRDGELYREQYIEPRNNNYSYSWHRETPKTVFYSKEEILEQNYLSAELVLENNTRVKLEKYI
jgi:hypothetical protein